MSKVTRRYSKKCNADFFKIWNPTMAYWLGFMFADGCIAFRNKQLTSGQMKLELKCTDALHVQKFQSALRSGYKIGYQIAKKSRFCSVRHQILNIDIVHDLNNLGCVPRKSLCLQWLNYLPTQFENHFIRGYFDGDGCISYEQRGHAIHLSFAGTYSFLSAIRDKLSLYLEHKHNQTISDAGNTGRLQYCGTAKCVSICDWMYDNSDASTRLDRKYALYEQFKKISHLKPRERATLMNDYLCSNEWRSYFECNNKLCPRRVKR